MFSDPVQLRSGWPLVFQLHFLSESDASYCFFLQKSQDTHTHTQTLSTADV